MSRTGLDAQTIARAFRDAAGDGSMEWTSQPWQASVLLDAADLLDENAKLRELLGELYAEYRYMRVRPRAVYLGHETRMREIERRMRELGVKVTE